MHVLTELQKHAGHAGILTHGQRLFRRDRNIIAQKREYALCSGKGLLALRTLDGSYNIVRQAEICLDAQPCNGIFNKLCVYVFHFSLHILISNNYKQK